MIPDFIKDSTLYVRTDKGFEELGGVIEMSYEAEIGMIPTFNMRVVVTYKEHKDDSIDAIRYNQDALGIWEKENPCMKEVDNMDEIEVEKTHVIDPNNLDRGIGLVVGIGEPTDVMIVYFKDWTEGHNCQWYGVDVKDKYKHGAHCWNYTKSELSIVDTPTQIKNNYVEKEEMKMKETKKLYGLVDMYKERAVEKIDEYFDEKIDNIIENDKRIVDYKNIVLNFNNAINEFINGLDDKERRMFEEYSDDMITYPFEIAYDEVEQYLDVDKINNAKTLELQDLAKMLKEVYAHLDLVDTADEGMFTLNDIYDILTTYDILDEHNHLKEYTIKNVIDDKK